MQSLNEAITGVITGRNIKEENDRENINERVKRDETHLTKVGMESMTPFQQKELKKFTDKMFTIVGPNIRNFTIHKDERYNGDVEVHFDVPVTGFTFTSTDFAYLSKVKFFYINISKTKLVVTFI